MDGLDRIERHDEVPRILYVDHQLRSAVRGDLTHRAEHLPTVDRKHLIAYRNLFAHDVALQHSYSLTWHAYSITVDHTLILMRCAHGVERLDSIRHIRRVRNTGMTGKHCYAGSS